MPFYTDQLVHQIFLDDIPQRIISIVPSQTELLYDLGLNEEIVAITRFCIHPKHWFKTKTRIGGTKQLHLDQIIALKPDLIIANKEENRQDEVEELMKHVPVWTSDISDLETALQMICSVGSITGKIEKAQVIENQIREGFKSLQLNRTSERPKACYLIWRDPYMTIGGDTFIHDLLQRAGFENVFAHRSRYPAISIEEISNAGCDLIMLSSEPYPFREKHIIELQEQIPGSKCMLVDGEMFSWYGSRLLHAPSYFHQLQLRAISVL